MLRFVRLICRFLLRLEKGCGFARSLLFSSDLRVSTVLSLPSQMGHLLVSFDTLSIYKSFLNDPCRRPSNVPSAIHFEYFYLSMIHASRGEIIGHTARNYLQHQTL